MPRTGRPKMPVEQIWARVKKGVGADDCWIYNGPVNSSGYGTVARKPAHRWSYEQFNGPIPAGLHIDHTCKQRRCINPAHLEAVTVRENVMRSAGFAANNARKARCPRGHELNGLRGNGYRYCKTCAADHERQKRAAHRAANPLEKQMECRLGHPLWGTNVYVDRRGYRRCKTCFNAYMRRRRSNETE